MLLLSSFFFLRASANMFRIVFILNILSTHLVAAFATATAAVAAICIVCEDADRKVHGLSSYFFYFLITAEK